MADHYQTLGVEPDADLTIIKRRYRLLVRENHPDAVEASRRQNAHELMLAINAAWTILSDPAERARYDRSRMPVVVPPSSGERAAQASRGAQTSSAAPQSASSRGATPRSSSSSRTSGRSRTAARGANPRTRLLTMVFEAAELYFFHGRAQEAIEMCNRVMQFDPRNAEAPALLGDIYAEQGRKDVAVLMYERAVRNQPDNALYRQKWEQLKTATSSSSSASASNSAPRASSSGAGGAVGNGAASGGGPRYGPNANRGKYNVSQRMAQAENAQSSPATSSRADAATPASNGSAATPYARVVSSSGATAADATAANATTANATATSATSANATSANMSSGTVVPPNLGGTSVAGERASDRPNMAGGFALASIATGLVVWGNLELAPSAHVVVEPTVQQLLLTSAGGAVLGAALPLLNMVKGCGQVRRGAPSFTGAPLVFCLALAGAVAFPLAWLLYLLASMAWRLWHKSLLTVLTVALFLSGAMLAAVPNNQASEQTMNFVESVLIFWSGRAILPSVIGGWAIGSLLRRR